MVPSRDDLVKMSCCYCTFSIRQPQLAIHPSAQYISDYRNCQASRELHHHTFRLVKRRHKPLSALVDNIFSLPLAANSLKRPALPVLTIQSYTYTQPDLNLYIHRVQCSN